MNARSLEAGRAQVRGLSSVVQSRLTRFRTSKRTLGGHKEHRSSSQDLLKFHLYRYLAPFQSHRGIRALGYLSLTLGLQAPYTSHVGVPTLRIRPRRFITLLANKKPLPRYIGLGLGVQIGLSPLRNGRGAICGVAKLRTFTDDMMLECGGTDLNCHGGR